MCMSMCVREVCMCLNILVFRQFDTPIGLVMVSRSKYTSVGAKTVKVPLSVLGTTAGIQTFVTSVENKQGNLVEKELEVIVL